VPGGAITAIEVDYSTVRVEPSTPAMEALSHAMVQEMAASGWSDAGTLLPGWLPEAGFREVERVWQTCASLRISPARASAGSCTSRRLFASAGASSSLG
jgi:hypothetical protein